MELNDKERELGTLLGILEGLENNLPQMKEGELKEALLTLIKELPEETKEGIEPGLSEMERRLLEGGRLRRQEIEQAFAGLKKEMNDGLQLIIGGKAQIQAGLEEISARNTTGGSKDAAGL